MVRSWLVCGVFLFAILSSYTLSVNAYESPHNNSFNVDCLACHSSPVWSWSSGDVDSFCLSCHDTDTAPFTTTNAPLVKTHSSANTSSQYGSWSMKCTVCHSPHYQEQRHLQDTVPGELFLATGTALSAVHDNGSPGTTAIAVNAINYKSGWNAAGLIAKTSTGRNAVMIPNISRPYINFPVVSISGTTITVNGNAEDNVSLGSYGIIYGQLIKDVIATPNSGSRNVKFVDKNAFVNGAAAYDGTCEVCHTLTEHYRNSGAGNDPGHSNIFQVSSSNCTAECHLHINGFAHVGTASGHTAATGCGTASTCHGLQDSHPAHVTDATDGVLVTCADCHSATYPYFKSGTDSNGNGVYELSETNVCETCHKDGAGNAATRPAWGADTIGCNGCHGFGPNYENGNPKANSHSIHASYTCEKCHNSTTTTGNTVTTVANHINDVINIENGGGVTFSYTSATKTCSSVSCHSSTSAVWGSTACLGCHSVSIVNRAAAGAQFSANSHHIQNVTASNTHCYQCHWEASSTGFINTTYHGGTASSGAVVNLVLYGNTTRPGAYTVDSTAIQYTANNSRSEIDKLTTHCLSCHKEQNNSITPFSGDDNTPRRYAWDTKSIDARYTQPAGVTTWGKYTGTTNATKKNLQKAYSAHGNATANREGWDTTNGVDGDTITDFTGAVNVACFDCHNSHGSTVGGTTTSYASEITKGGILKDVTNGKGGYTVNYKPVAAGSVANKDVRNEGASLCFDCHMISTAGTTTSGSYSAPWGANSTFGVNITARIMGYWDTPYFSPGGTFGSTSRYAYKTSLHKGGHYGASSATITDYSATPINGLCTPCHDPHGVSPTISSCSKSGYYTQATCTAAAGTWSASPELAVPLLKGTWLTSLYKEDVAPSVNTYESVETVDTGVVYHIDQNTFGTDIRTDTTFISQTDSQFAGLCLGCHAKTALTDGTTHTWLLKNRIHESVKDWKTANATIKHKYSCSKCHTVHNSRLPRLMVTNCLDPTHKGRVQNNTTPITSGANRNVCAGGSCYYGPYSYSGSGQIPGTGSGSGSGYWGGGSWSRTTTCHGATTNQDWNTVTPWP